MMREENASTDNGVEVDSLDVWLAEEPAQPAEEAEGETRKGKIGLWMTSLYVGLFIIRPWEVMFPMLGALHFERFFAIFMLICVALTTGFRLRLTFQSITIIGFVAAGGISTILSYNPALAWENYYPILTVLVCYIVMISVIRRPNELVFILISYIFFMGLYLSKALWEYFVNGQRYYDQGVHRLGGIETSFGHYNALAGSIVLSLPIWLYLWDNRREITAKWKALHRQWFRYGAVLYLVLALVSLAMTNSRKGMICFCVFIVLSSVRKARLGTLWKKALIAVLIMSAAWVVLPDEQKNRLRTLWDPEAGPANAQASTEGRVVAFQAAVAIFEKNPLLGVGPGNFKDYRQSYGDGIYLSPHNLLGNVISELGILGTATFLLVVVATFLNCAKMKALARRVRHPDVLVLNGLGIACRNAVILLLVEGISDHDLYRFNWFWLAAFCLVALECYREAETELETIAVDAVEEPVPEFAEEF